MHGTFARFEKLRHASDMDEASVLLARTVGEAARAENDHVFLLDNTREKLLHVASWFRSDGAALEGRHAVPAWDVNDPLCLSLQKGGKLSFTWLPGMPLPPSLSVIQPEASLPAAPIAVWPLLACRNEAIGGIILTYGADAPACDDEIRLLCAHGA